jgi:hypothetical protein
MIILELDGSLVRGERRRGHGSALHGVRTVARGIGRIVLRFDSASRIQANRFARIEGAQSGHKQVLPREAYRG